MSKEDMIKETVEGLYDEKDSKLIKKARSPRNIYKGVKVFNQLCRRCKLILRQNVRTGEKDYCARCKKLIEEVFS